MERHSFLVNEGSYDGAKLEMEIAAIQKLLPYIESFNAFVTNNDICDIRNHKFITNITKISKSLKDGLGCITKYFVFCKN